MMAESCRQWRPALAAWVLGQLEGREADDLVAHLTGCEGCRAEISELTGVAAALRLADPPRNGPPQPPAELGDAVAARVAAERAAVKRTRLRRLTAAAAAVVLLVVGAVAWWPTGGDEAEPARVAAAVTDAAEGVDAEVDVEERGWGSSVNITLSGVDSGSVYRVWVEDVDGERHSAGTFLGVDGEMHCYMAAATRWDDAAVVGIDDADGAAVLRGQVPVEQRAGRR